MTDTMWIRPPPQKQSLWKRLWRWNLFEFGAAKAFSDFVGFHVRAFFCLTLVIVALLPSIDAYVTHLETGDTFVTPYSTVDGLFQVTAAALFTAYFLVLFWFIARSAFSWCVGRWFVTGRRITQAVSLLIGLPFFVALLAMEIAAMIAVAFRVFLMLSFTLVTAESERAALDAKWCVMHKNAQALGLHVPAWTECENGALGTAPETEGSPNE